MKSKFPGEVNKYNGGKNGSGVPQQIINLIPPHKFYIEPYFGSGAVYWWKLRSHTSILNDIDDKVMYRAEQRFSNVNKYGKTYCLFYNSNGLDILKAYQGLSKECFAYLDPPYPFEVRQSERKLYKYEMSENDHVELLEFIIGLKMNVMISSYKNPLYDSMLKGWNVHSFETMSRNGTRTESIYMNYDKPELLHDYSNLGNDFRERELKRKLIKGYSRRIKKMDNLTRQAILNDLYNNFKDDFAIIQDHNLFLYGNALQRFL